MSDVPPPETKIRCKSCGGHWQDRHGHNACRHCTQGWMTAAQLGAWKRRASGRMPAVKRSSATAFDPARAIILDRLCKAWDKVPEMRLGELICDALAYMHMAPTTLERLDNERLAEIVEHYLLFGSRTE